MSEETKAAAVGHIPSGLFIVCAQDNEGKRTDGYLASWVQQVSFKPLMISVAVKPGRPAYDSIMNGNVFTINVVGEHEKGIMKHFWSGYDPAKNPFDEIDHEVTADGGVILKQAKSVIECRLHSKQTPGDHDIVFAEVLNSRVLNEEAKPLTHIRKTGLDY